ncbi:MAG TPA: DUF192 domain-containing protein [Bryobacteraceae bacterium]|nr:DUF192 domain-containing protein [Bryobacteraceae bacterium]
MLSKPMQRAGCAWSAMMLALALGGCANADKQDDLAFTVVTLPNGKQIRAETVYRDLDITRGLMFREKLAADRGMLFLHTKMDKYQYWTYNLKFPVDIVWMDEQHKVVEVYPSAPPCTLKSARECTTYGGRHLARFVLEMNANTAVPNGIREGVYLMF